MSARLLSAAASSFVQVVRCLGRFPGAIAIAFVVACGAPDDPGHRAHEVERRILAPCCKRQTLEDHDSELARALRAEIEQRTVAGERPETIEDDLVRRYGEDVRAMPRGSNPRGLIGGAIGVALGLGALVLVRLLVRRRNRTAVAVAVAGAATGAGIASAVDLDFEDQLDDELRELD